VNPLSGASGGPGVWAHCSEEWPASSRHLVEALGQAEVGHDVGPDQGIGHGLGNADAVAWLMECGFGRGQVELMEDANMGEELATSSYEEQPVTRSRVALMPRKTHPHSITIRVSRFEFLLRHRCSATS
jgi:hypothetical protein